MSNESKTPLITKTAFSCPHCGAFTTQHWYQLFADSYIKEPRTPTIPKPEFIKNITTEDLDQEAKNHLHEWFTKMQKGTPFFKPNTSSLYGCNQIYNFNISKCYNCSEITVWIHDHIVYPNTRIDIQPNNDLPAHIRQLFEEAREIVGSSSKGAAALLRLCVQYLCKELGESGKNLDDDIASLVGKGLNPLVQKALDVVRVIGNKSVHPGEIDLNDNKEIAIKLFGLVNLICEQMISHPKQVEELYDDLPPSKLEGIEKRNEKAKRGK